MPGTAEIKDGEGVVQGVGRWAGRLKKNPALKEEQRQTWKPETEAQPVPPAACAGGRLPDLRGPCLGSTLP